MLLPSSSLKKIRPASEAEIVHPQPLGNFDNLGCALKSSSEDMAASLAGRTRRGEQFPSSFPRMCRLRVDPGRVQN